MLTPRSHYYRLQRGFTLIEVLVAVIVTSLGLLSVAGLQIISNKNNYDAIQRTTASMLAHEMISRMRANRQQLNLYITRPSSPLGRGSLGQTAPSPDCSSSSNPCNAAQLARQDLWQWEQALDGASEQRDIDGDNTDDFVGGLVLPTACITGPPAGSNGLYTVAIAWRGVAPVGNPSGNTCGEGTGLYGTNNEYRRLLVMNAYF